MRRLILEAPAKINLSLDVIGRRADGYHLLSTVMQSLRMADRVSLTVDLDKPGIDLSCDRNGLPTDQRNTAWRAASLFLSTVGLSGQPGSGIKIEIEKKIPVEAGLAGGSADAAAVLFGLDQLFPGLIPEGQLYELAVRIGADVPFCLKGGTVLCEGIGERLTPLPVWPDLPILLCKPAGGLLTSWVFGQLKMETVGLRPDQAGVLAAITHQDLSSLARNTANVLEAVSLPAMPELSKIKRALMDGGAELAMMSGSGPTVFGIFRDSARLAAASQIIGQLHIPDLELIATSSGKSGPQPVCSDLQSCS